MSIKKKKTRDDLSSKKRSSKLTIKKEPKTATKGVYKSIPYESLDELGALQWLFELKNYGYIKSIKRAESYLLSPGLTSAYVEKNARSSSSRPCTQTLLHGHSYTPEFEVIWHTKALDKLVWIYGTSTKYDKYLIGEWEERDGEQELITYIEVKPSFDQNNMERLFKLNQKWMWDKFNIFVNLMKIKDLFTHSFTPKEYLVTPSGRVRVLKWKNKTLSQFLNPKV